MRAFSNRASHNSDLHSLASLLRMTPRSSVVSDTASSQRWPVVHLTAISGWRPDQLHPPGDLGNKKDVRPLFLCWKHVQTHQGRFSNNNRRNRTSLQMQRKLERRAFPFGGTVTNVCHRDLAATLARAKMHSSFSTASICVWVKRTGTIG